jgi:putative peptide maturation system protein
MPPSRFDESLGAAVALLRELPRGRRDVDEARRRVSAFRAANGPLRADLVVDQPPASTAVDYDLLLDHPEGGTVALSWRRDDDGTPWLVDYSDHWASNFVVSVGETHLTIEQALAALRLRQRHEPGLMEELLREAVIASALASDPPEVTAEELQRAADDFRRANRLFGAEATHRWLASVGLTAESWRALLRGGVQARKLSERVTAGQLESYFAEHRADFDTVRYVRLSFAGEEEARRAAAEALMGGGLLGRVTAMMADETGAESVQGSFGAEPASELPPELAGATPGDLVGPVPDGARYWIAEVVARTPAPSLDNERTRRAVQARLFQRWVEEQCASQGVRWHWM